MVGVGVRVPLIALAGLGGSGYRERKWEEKFHRQGQKMEFFSLNRIKNGPNIA